MKGQKEAVIELVKQTIPNFTPYQDRAIIVLTSQQLEDIKAAIFNGIVTGTIEYGKDRTNHSEVRTYARSMVMNHLKKAKELNGNVGMLGSVKRVTAKLYPKGVTADALTEELKEFAKTLV